MFAQHIASAHPNCYCTSCKVGFQGVKDLSQHYHISEAHPGCTICGVEGFQDESTLSQVPCYQTSSFLHGLTHLELQHMDEWHQPIGNFHGLIIATGPRCETEDWCAGGIPKLDMSPLQGPPEVEINLRSVCSRLCDAFYNSSCD
jgi:hypothetical protein